VSVILSALGQSRTPATVAAMSASYAESAVSGTKADTGVPRPAFGDKADTDMVDLDVHL